ncbi:MAG: hypothetical protein IPN94_19485 [Sphingobacteriales bacterium]|nr:hypothetical protein [Sphingobacteriales bacterium]
MFLVIAYVVKHTCCNGTSAAACCIGQLKVKVPDTFLVAVSNIEKVSVPSDVLRQAFVPLV